MRPSLVSSLSVVCCGAWLLVSRSCPAQGTEVSIWYRSSEGCPSGAEFVKRLAELGRRAQLAGAGDRIDFVVTLGSETAESAGRLERQTESGTVAIREVKAGSCQQVSEALALSLDLALGPRSDPETEASSPPVEPDTEEAVPAPTDPATTPAPPGSEPAPPAGAESAPRSSFGEPSKASAARHGAPGESASHTAPPAELETGGLRHAVGLEGTLATGVAPDPLLGLSGVFELGGPAYDSPSARLHLGLGRSESRSLEFVLMSGRLEGCLPLLGSQAFRLGPCVHLELGSLQADYSAASGSRDTGVWSSLGANLLAGVRVYSSLALEAQAGGQVPLRRYTTTGENGETLARTQSLGFSATLGVIWHQD